jgi:hypothetical protein
LLIIGKGGSHCGSGSVCTKPTVRNDCIPSSRLIVSLKRCFGFYSDHLSGARNGITYFSNSNQCAAPGATSNHFLGVLRREFLGAMVPNVQIPKHERRVIAFRDCPGLLLCAAHPLEMVGLRWFVADALTFSQRVWEPRSPNSPPDLRSSRRGESAGRAAAAGLCVCLAARA